MAPRAHVVCFGASDQAEARAWATRVFPDDADEDETGGDERRDVSLARRS